MKGPLIITYLFAIAAKWDERRRIELKAIKYLTKVGKGARCPPIIFVKNNLNKQGQNSIHKQSK